MNPTKIEFDRRLELTFPGVPPVATRAALQKVGFTFDGRKRVWYLRQEPNVEYAPGGKIQFVDGWARVLGVFRSLFGLSELEAAKLSEAREHEHNRAGVEGMLEANGII